MRKEDPLDIEQQGKDVDSQSDQPPTMPLNPPLTGLKCSHCGNEFFKEESAFVPFCSKRCQQIDLGHWLAESYGLPVESGDGELPPDYDTEEEDI